MKCLLIPFLLILIFTQSVFTANFLESLCLKCNTTVEMLLPPKIDTFYAMSDLFIKNGICSKLSDSFEDTCFTLINVPLRVQYNLLWTFVSPFRELICMPFCLFD